MGDNDDVIEIACAIQLAEAVVGERISVRTKEGYASGIRQVKKFLSKHPQFSHHIVDNVLMVPLPCDAIKSFFGANSRKSSGESKSFSALNGYRCAIKSYYVEKKVNATDIEVFDKFVNDFLHGTITASTS